MNIPEALSPPTLLAAIARRTGNAVIVTDRAGLIVWVNDGFTRLTGHEAEAVVGLRPASLLQGADTSPETRAEMARCIAAGRSFDVVVLNYTRDQTQYWVRIQAEPTLDDAGAVTGYVALQTDVTEALIAGSRERLITRMGDALLCCDDLVQAAGAVVDELVSTPDVRAAQVWVVDPGATHLRHLAGAGADDDARPWIEVGRSTSFARGDAWVVGVGAPGMAWGTGRPCSRTDFWQRDRNGMLSRRSEAAQAARIRTVCAVPVMGPEGVIAVIEIGGSHRYPGHERLPTLVGHVARQFGAFMLRHQSRIAFETLFQRSPDALLVTDRGRAVLRANARAQALFGSVIGAGLDALLAESDSLDGSDGTTLHRRDAQRVDGTSFSAEVTLADLPGAGAEGAIVAVRDLTERHRVEAELRRTVDEKTVLIQEVHHRVKNNLQIVSSLLALQAASVTDAAVREALFDTTRRIQSMALVHQQLYARDSVGRIAFDEYARLLCHSLRSSIGGDARLTFEADAISESVDRAVPAGLILNELLTNAFKYGRNAQGQCRVHVRVRRDHEGWCFVVADEGAGLDEARPSGRSLGFTIIHALLKQLRAKRTDDPAAAPALGIQQPVQTLIRIGLPPAP
jgi:PAS domain S-box-containing protein